MNHSQQVQTIDSGAYYVLILLKVNYLLKKQKSANGFKAARQFFLADPEIEGNL
jgi:hypothetical protein